MSSEQTPMMQAMAEMSSYNSSDAAEVEILEKEVFGSDTETAPRAPVNMKAFLDGDEKEQSAVDKILERISNAVMPGAQAMGAGTPRQNELVSKGSKLTQKNLKAKKDPQAEYEKNFPQSQQAMDPNIENTNDYVFGGKKPNANALWQEYVDRTGDTPGSDAEIEQAVREQEVYNDLTMSDEEVRQKYRDSGEPASEEYLRYLEGIRKNDEGNFDEMATELNSWVMGKPSVFDKGDPYNGK